MKMLNEIPKIGKTILVSAFPGTGKSHYCNMDYMPERFASDSDSSAFDKIDFPNNYINHIKQRIIDGYCVVFISSHKDVREALVNQGLPFVMVYPSRELKDEYLQRYRDRGSSNDFIELLEKNWDEWITECESQTSCYHIKLNSNQFLSNVI